MDDNGIFLSTNVGATEPEVLPEPEKKPVKKQGRPKKASQETSDGRVLIFMQYGAGWSTPSGIDFSEEHPYKLVDAGEAGALLQEPRFRKATADEVKFYYQVGE